MDKQKTTYAFVDAANLFYGGKDYDWKIDYKKLHQYLSDRYKCSKIIFYGGVETHGFSYSILEYYKEINLDELLEYLIKKMHNSNTPEKEVILIDRHIKQVQFYQKLKIFGYELRLKPVKLYRDTEGNSIKKANCDVDMTFDLMKLMGQFEKVVIISGDGDFVPVLSYLKHKNKQIVILAHPKHTAKELKILVGANFNNFTTLKKYLEFID